MSNYYTQDPPDDDDDQHLELDPNQCFLCGKEKLPDSDMCLSCEKQIKDEEDENVF